MLKSESHSTPQIWSLSKRKKADVDRESSEVTILVGNQTKTELSKKYKSAHYHGLLFPFGMWWWQHHDEELLFFYFFIYFCRDGEAEQCL